MGAEQFSDRPPRLSHMISVAESDIQKAQLDLQRTTSEALRRDATSKLAAASVRKSYLVVEGLHYGLEEPPLSGALDAPRHPQDERPTSDHQLPPYLI